MAGGFLCIECGAEPPALDAACCEQPFVIVVDEATDRLADRILQHMLQAVLHHPEARLTDTERDMVQQQLLSIARRKED